jgi:hypothetical protein
MISPHWQVPVLQDHHKVGEKWMKKKIVLLTSAITNKVMALRGGQAFQIPKEAGRDVWNTA